MPDQRGVQANASYVTEEMFLSFVQHILPNTLSKCPMVPILNSSDVFRRDERTVRPDVVPVARHDVGEVKRAAWVSGALLL
jgi:hypothetical protein